MTGLRPGVPATANTQPLGFGTPVSTGVNGTSFFPIGSLWVQAALSPPSTERLCGQFIVPCAGIVSKLYARLLTANTAAQSQVLTVRKNETDTTLTVSFAISALIDSQQSDLANSFTVVAGDRLDIKCVGSGAAAPTTFAGGLQFQPT